jgi:hypothetical protein
MSRVMGKAKRGTTQQYLSMSDEELAFVDRSLREGKGMLEISRELGYGTQEALRRGIEERGFKRGVCLVSMRASEVKEDSVSAEEREYLEITSAFTGRKRATVALVALILRQIVKACEIYTADYPQYRRSQEREKGL